MTTTYTSLLNAFTPSIFHSEGTAEKKNPYHVFTERHMQAMWLEQKYFNPIRDLNHQVIEIVSPGIWNSEAGPDFLKAHIKIGNREMRGDIELHLAQEGWYHHNHHLDDNYNHVILHICFWLPRKQKAIITAAGNSITTVYLQPLLTVSEGRILKLIDLDLYPYKHFAGTGSCSKTLFNQLPKEKTISLLRSAAAWRLKEKNERIKTKIEDSNYLLGAIAMTLGYKHNAEAFLDIYHELTSLKTSEEHVLYNYALDLCDFFKPFFQKKWGDSPFYQQLLKTCRSHSSSFQDRNSKRIHLKLDKIRPANHPVRRLALLVKIMNDPEIKNLDHRLLSLWKSKWESCQKQGWSTLKIALLELMPTYEDDYWNSHYIFEKSPSEQKKIALIGADLKREILVNVYLPILYEIIENQEDDREKQAFINFYGSLPASKTKKSLYLNHRFFGNKEKLKISSADLQQGAYQIHRDFCVHFEASCQGCPFVERYQNSPYA